MSFWLPGSKGSAPSELQVSDEVLHIGKKYTVIIKVADLPFLEGHIKPGSKFYIGTYPESIATGIVQDIIK